MSCGQVTLEPLEECRYAPEKHSGVPKIAPRRDVVAGHLERRLLGEPTNGIHMLSGRQRSEEHTSELQSRRDLVCRLLLEKKKNQHHNQICGLPSHAS